MPPTAADLALARDVAAQIVQAGTGRIRRVVLVGSRALGTAQPYSDLDLVVLVELPEGVKPWGNSECEAEREHIARRLTGASVKVELWLRTTEQYQEHRRVECSLEWRVEAEGVEVYRRALDRPAVARRPLADVRRENVFGWISHGVRALDAAVAMETESALKGVATPPPALRAAHAAVMRAVTALLVQHRIHASKHDGLDAMLTQLAHVSLPAATRMWACLAAQPLSARGAHAAVQEVTLQLTADAQLAPLLKSIRQRLAHPTVFLEAPAVRHGFLDGAM